MKWILFAWKNVMRNKRRSLTAMLITAMGTAAVLIGGGFALFTYQSLEEMTARDSGHVVLAAARGFDADEDVPLQHGLTGAAALAAEYAALTYLRNGVADVLLVVRVPMFDGVPSVDLLESTL